MAKNNSNTHYRVFIHVTRLLGETWAASAARAISNVKYRLGLKKPMEYAKTLDPGESFDSPFDDFIYRVTCE